MSTVSPTIPAASAVLRQILVSRRSCRELAPTPLEEQELAELLWAAQGITDSEGRRTAPSAGATYPLEVYAVTPAGVLHYEAAADRSVTVRAGDHRAELAAAAGQETPGVAPVTIVIVAVVSRLEARFGPEKAGRYLFLDVGHCAQNVLLEAASLGLAAVPMASFDADRVRSVLGLPEGNQPVELLPIGRRAV